MPTKGTRGTFNVHRVLLDKEGKLLSWFNPQQLAYDHVMWLAWDFIKNKVPVEDNGLKTYLTYPKFDRSPPFRGLDYCHHPGELYGYFVDSLLSYYPYSGDRSLINIVQEMLDYHIDHGLTPADWDWPNVPFSASDAGATQYQGADESRYEDNQPGKGDGVGVIASDKVGELGVAYLYFFKLTGKEKYLKMAVACANAIASHLRPGDADHSPIPFRVYAWNGIVREEYSSNMIGAVKLFDELIHLKHPSKQSYKKARDKLWEWLLAYPMRNNKWKGYYFDNMLDPRDENRDQVSAMETARYILQHPEMDPDWHNHVPRLINWVELTFGQEEWGAQSIKEQLWCFGPMGSHTARFASICALWYEKTGDEAYKEKAYRTFNYATYLAAENGVIDVSLKICRDDKGNYTEAGDPSFNDAWFSVGYADYVKHFMAGLGSIPEWAPKDENHLLRSSSIITNIQYSDKQISYKTFDSDSIEVLRLNFTPHRVTADNRTLNQSQNLDQQGWSWDTKLGVLRVHHKESTNIQVKG